MNKAKPIVLAVALALLASAPQAFAQGFTNGNFESGNTGFSSEYTYSPSDLFSPGTYTVDTNPRNNHPLFYSIGDHTTGTGRMMIINGAQTSGVVVWESSPSAALVVGQQYDFSVWVASVYPESPARLTFSVGSTLLGTLSPSADGTWNRLVATFTAQEAFPIFRLVNSNGAYSGNDFALDDFAISPGTTPPTLIVTNTNNSGPGSLRQAVLDANATATAEHIIFDASFNSPQTITLTTGDIVLAGSGNANVTIIGPGANLLTVSGNNNSRIFSILENSVVNISGMTLTGGNGGSSGPGNGFGGAVNNQGVLTLSNMIITGNTAGASGGGIYAEDRATLSLSNSTVSGNMATTSGGGIAFDIDSTATISRSTISGNTAAMRGGGVHLQPDEDNLIKIESSTISGNMAPTGAGIYREPSGTLTVTLSSTTVANNTATNIGGGVVGTMNAGNTLIGNNTDNGTAPDYSGTLNSQGYNLLENTAGATVTGDTATNITGVDPNLGPLANNGGPTFTHALLSGSPALDQGKSFGTTTDQRGGPRPNDIPAIANASGGDGADIGANEVQANAVLAAVSRKTHGSAGTFDIPLPLTGEPGVECRSSGGNHTLVFTFTHNLVSGSASLTTGVGSVQGSPSFNGKTMTVNLTGVADVQRITVTSSNVTDEFSQVLPSTAVSVNMLVGDINGSKVVNASDIGAVKAQSGLPVTSANFRADVAVSGGITASDIGLVKSRSGASVP
jgi:predicted outer membrane repeat protein